LHWGLNFSWQTALTGDRSSKTPPERRRLPNMEQHGKRLKFLQSASVKPDRKHMELPRAR
jgi:hypothetical protein